MIFKITKERDESSGSPNTLDTLFEKNFKVIVLGLRDKEVEAGERVATKSKKV